MRYKVGDRVYLRDDLDKTFDEGCLDWLEGMIKGEWVEIKRVHEFENDYRIEGDNEYCYDDYMIDHEKTAQLSTDTPNEKQDDKAEIFKEITDEMYQLYKDKNEDYGDSFKKVRDEYPEAIIIRLMDKLGRLKSLYKGDVNIKDEGIENVLIDMANYCVMEMVERKKSSIED